MADTMTTHNGIDVRALNGTHNIGEITMFTHAGSEDRSRTTPFVTHGDEPPVLLPRRGRREGAVGPDSATRARRTQ